MDVFKWYHGEESGLRSNEYLYWQWGSEINFVDDIFGSNTALYPGHQSGCYCSSASLPFLISVARRLKEVDRYPIKKGFQKYGIIITLPESLT